MKPPLIVWFSVSMVLLFGSWRVLTSRARAQTESPLPVTQNFEYASVRFMEEKSSIVWPDGSTETVLELIGGRKLSKNEYYPKGTDFRMYYLTRAMNILAGRGFELVHMHENDVVMRRRPIPGRP